MNKTLNLFNKKKNNNVKCVTYLREVIISSKKTYADLMNRGKYYSMIFSVNNQQ